MVECSLKFKQLTVAVVIDKKPMLEQCKTAHSILRQHYRENDGQCSFFGVITGYMYCRTYNNTIEFSVTGKLAKLHEPSPEAERASLTVSGKSCTPRFIKLAWNNMAIGCNLEEGVEG